MPELPEVETSRRGIEPYLVGQTILYAVVRNARLRWPVSEEILSLSDQPVLSVQRRAKYLLIELKTGWIIVHLGMSGSLRLVTAGTVLQKHDHVDLVFAHTTLRLRDPRRFGALLWLEGDSIATHPALAKLGIEPLTPEFDGEWLYAATRQRSGPIKSVLMDSHLVVGIGNIYASESLFLAGVSPLRAANRISRARYHVLVPAIRQTLETAIAAGGSSFRDYVHSDGGAGSFQLTCAVYGRDGKPCPKCAQPLRTIRQAGRSTFYCASCQR